MDKDVAVTETEAEAVGEKAPEENGSVKPKSLPEKVNPASLVEVADGRGIMLRSLSELTGFAGMLVREGAAPKGMSVGHVAIAIQAGMERGLGPLGGLQNGVVINGRFAWNGQGAFSLIQQSRLCRRGTLKKWIEGEGDDRAGVAEAWRVGYDKPQRVSFSTKDAKRAGLWGKEGPWRQYPERMLQWRALGLLARDLFPDVLGGFPIAEELEDYAYADAKASDSPKVSRLTIPEDAATPGKPDPLADILDIEPLPETETAAEGEDTDEPEFESHEEADREIARQDGLFEPDKS